MDIERIIIDNHDRSLFFATLLAQCDISFTTDINTAATDGTRILLNENFCQENIEYMYGILIHEALHIAYEHAHRRKTREPKRWNAACDYVINLEIINSNIELPPGCLINPAYTNLSAETVYELLDDRCNTPDFGGDIPDGTTISGILPGGFAIFNKRELTAVKSETFSIHEVLTILSQIICSTTYDFTIYDHRFIHKREYIEALAPTKPKVAVLVDMSSSMIYHNALSRCRDYINQLTRHTHVTEFYLFDSDCQGPFSELPELTAGGATHLAEAMEKIGLKIIEPYSILICFTDGYVPDGLLHYPDVAQSTLYVIPSEVIPSEFSIMYGT